MRPYREIFRLVWPLALGMVNNALMQFIDRAFLARESMASLEAVMPASMLALVVLGLFQAIVAYSGTFVANYHGAGDWRGCISCYRAGTVLAVFFGIVSLLFIPLGGWIFENVADGPEVIERGRSYYSICTAGGIFLYGQMAVQSFFTGRGKTRAVFFVNILGNVVNIALDPVFIFGWFGLPALGISGAAYATVVAMLVQWAVMAVMAHRDIAQMRRMPGGGGECRDVNFMALLRRILRFGIPAGAYSTLNLVSFTIFVFFTARVGHLEAAVSNACFAVNYLIFAPIEGFALGAATLVAQAKGAGDVEAARKAGWRTAFLALTVTIVLLSVTLALNGPIMSLFAPDDAAMAGRFKELGFVLLMLMAAWQVFEVFDTVICGALKGAGDTAFVMWWMLLVSFALWIPSVAVVSLARNTMPLLWGTMILQVAVLCGGSVLRWRRGGWKSIVISA